MRAARRSRSSHGSRWRPAKTRRRALAEQSIELAQAAGDKLTESGALGTLAELAAADGDYAEAVRLYERGLELRRALGDRRLVANSLLSLGRDRAAAAASTTAAPRCSRKALVLARAVKDTWSVSVVLANLGRVRLLRDDAGAARGLLLDGLRLARDRNDRRVAAELVQGLAAVLASEGRQAESVRLLGAADALRETTGAALSPAEVLDRRAFPRAGSREPRRRCVRRRADGRAQARHRRGARARSRARPARGRGDGREPRRSCPRRRQRRATLLEPPRAALPSAAT